MRRQFGAAAAVAAVLDLVLIVALNAPAIDGLPIGVELTNTDVGTVGWIRVADDDGLEPQEFTIEAWVTPLGTAYSGTGDPVGPRIVIKPMESQVGSYLASYSLGLNLDQTVVAAVAHQLGSTGSTVSSTAMVPQGTRAHIAMSFDGTWLRVFVNGLLAYYSFNAGDLRDDSGHGHAGVADGLVQLVTSNDACLPFVADLETGDLSEWSDAVPR